MFMKSWAIRWFQTEQKRRHDIIQAVTLGSPEGVIAFCQGIQAAAPVDSYVEPEPVGDAGI